MNDLNFEAGQVIENFKVLSIKSIPDCNSVAVHLKHVTLGLEVYHLVNDSEENLFSFGFRTPLNSSTGVQHIMEHSVLAGSQNYPLKDPFISLEGQSVNTYMNASTSPDFTCFPASSVVKKDYFNLMKVYGDSVFFPLLREETFMQEGWRCQLDNNGKPEIQGIVFNEMKGVYSSFSNYLLDAVFTALFPKTHYNYDSGGNPLNIPELSYREFKSFHKKYYCPANCIVFLSGNIPTVEQLSFINQNILNRISDGGKKIPFPKENYSIKPPSTLKIKGPETQDGKSEILLAWNTSKFSKDGEPSAFRLFELIFLDLLLTGSDSSPLSKAVLASPCFSDCSNICGAISCSKGYAFSMGVTHADPKDAGTLKKIVINELKNIVKNGISEDHIKSSFLVFAVQQKEKQRSSGPSSLREMNSVIRSWAMGNSLDANLFKSEYFELLRKKVDEDPKYIQNLIKEIFLDNKNVCLITVTPSKEFSKKRIKDEEKLAAEIYKKLGADKVRKMTSRLNKFLEQNDSDELKSKLPSLSKSDLHYEYKPLKVKKQKVNNVDLFTVQTHTNGISYGSVLFPVDNIAPEDLKYVGFLQDVLTDIGWKDLSWQESCTKLETVLASFGSQICGYEVPLKKKLFLKNYQDRHYLEFNFKFLEQDTQEALQMISDCISGVSFNDTQRINDLLDSSLNDNKEILQKRGHLISKIRASAFASVSDAYTEIFNGITGFFSKLKLREMEIQNLCHKLNDVYQRIRSDGAVVTFYSDQKGLEIFNELAGKFVENAELIPVGKKKCNFNELKKALYLEDQTQQNQLEVFKIPGTVGYCSRVVYLKKNPFYLSTGNRLLLNYLSNGFLWEQVRNKSGAYGVFSNYNSLSQTVYFCSYRDPLPFGSDEVFADSMKHLLEKDISVTDVDNNIIGSFSSFLEPDTPQKKARLEISSLLDRIPQKNALKNAKRMLKSNKQTLYKTARRNIKKQLDVCTVILCPEQMILKKLQENENFTGKIFDLHL